MPRLYCPKERIRNNCIIIIDSQQIHYLCHVLRLKPKNNITVFDGEGNEYSCVVQASSRKAVELKVKQKAKVESCWRNNLTVACALPKQKSRFDDLIDKLTQLGVYKIIPMITERVVVRWDLKQRQRHNQRWLKIAKQASGQSGRRILPIIDPIAKFSQILSCVESYDLKLIPTLNQKKNLGDILSGSSSKNSLILIGPEGDFTNQELLLAKRAGFIPTCLGDLVLRVDTAAIAVASFFRLYETEKQFISSK